MSLHGKRKEIYKYEAPWTVYAMNWSVRPDKRFRLALGSFVEEYNNKVSEKMNCIFLLTSPSVESELISWDHRKSHNAVMWATQNRLSLLCYKSSPTKNEHDQKVNKNSMKCV